MEELDCVWNIFSIQYIYIINHLIVVIERNILNDCIVYVLQRINKNDKHRSNTIQEKSEEKDSEEYIVFVADGWVQTLFNMPRRQYTKIISCREYLITGTGTLSVLQNTVMELSKRQHATAEDVAKGILEITDTFKLTSKDSENFIVGGKTRKA